MGKIEPSADVRQAAHWAREMFIALCEKGFTEQQALTMIGLMIGSAVSAAGGSSAEN